jgi:hypothetical protein
MSICLSHTTAQDFWLHAAMREPEADPRAFESCTGDVAACRDELARAVPSTVLDANGRIHVLVPRDDLRGKAKGVAFHVHAAPIVPGMVDRIERHAFIVSPEYSFAQMAAGCTLARSALYGSYLCGSFRLPAGSAALEVPTRNPLTNRTRIASFIRTAHGMRGSGPARRALPWIIEGAASPREVQMALRLCLPFRYGGYGMPFPQMNAVIDLDADERKAVGKAFLKGDAVWPQAHLVLEYDGYYHASKAQMEADAVRRATLRHAGWTVIEVTNQQIVGIEAFDQIAQLVGKQLGRRLRSSYLGATPARIALVNNLFFTSRAPGR